MAELFQITKGQKAQPISELSFQDELSDLEPFIKDNPQVLGKSIEMFGEQVDTGAGDRIDLLALDKTVGTAQIVLIELKNEIAQQSVLLQTLRYASWVRNNPDSIKYLLEKKRVSAEKLDFNPKIIIVAQQIDPALIELSRHMQAEFDFVELRRFGTKDNCYLVVNRVTPPRTPITKVRSQEEWSWGRYETEFGVKKDQTEIGQQLFDKVINICQEKQWSLTPKFRQGYVPFQFGARNVILINYWFSGKSCHLGFKLGRPPEQLGLSDPYPDAEHKFWDDYGEYYVKIENPNTDISGYIPFMEAAYRNVAKA